MPSHHARVGRLGDERKCASHDGVPLNRASLRNALCALLPACQASGKAGFLTAEKATAEHFKGTPELFSFNPDWPVFASVELANALEYKRGADMKANTKLIKGFEKVWGKKAAETAAVAQQICRFSPEKPRAICTPLMPKALTPQLRLLRRKLPN